MIDGHRAHRPKTLTERFPILNPPVVQELGEGGVNEMRAHFMEQLEQVEIVPRWSVTGKQSGEPTGAAQLRLYFHRDDGRPYQFSGTYRSGTAWKLASVALATSTSKMDAVSFSLPAGTLETGGTCAAAQAAHWTPGHICRFCYAWGRANYGYPPTVLTQTVRLSIIDWRAAEHRLSRVVSGGPHD